MHAYLLLGGDEEERNSKAAVLSNKLGKQSFEFLLEKIEEVRSLAKFTKFSFEVPTCIVLKDIQNATPEALNAFLKNLEEPQKNITYVLTSTSEYKILPTILSRCQVVRLNSRSRTKSPEVALEFLKKSQALRLKATDAIRGREEAISYMEKLLLSIHALFISEAKNLKMLSDLLINGQKTLNALNSNGNVKLQLTNFVVNLSG